MTNKKRLQKIDKDLQYVIDKTNNALDTLVNPEDYLASVINKTNTELVNSKIVELSGGFQNNNTNLVRVELPSLVTLSGDSVFNGCTNLTVLKVPSLKSALAGEFAGQKKMTSYYFPSLETLNSWGYNFNQNYAVERIYFAKLTDKITSGDFDNCQKLTTLILGASTVCTLANTGAFNRTPIALYNNTVGYIYVPRALVDSYKVATNWSVYASQIRAIEDYPEVLEGWE